MISTAFMNSCKEQRQFGYPEKQAVGDTIGQLMAKMLFYAEKANTDSTFQWLSDESTSLFMSGGMVYSKSELISMFRNIYNNLKGQNIEELKHQVMVFSPDAAAWIAVLKGNYVTLDDKMHGEFLVETWIWQREPSGWKVVHYHESYLNMPDEAQKVQVEQALTELAKNIGGKTLIPSEMPAILTEFLKKNPVIYGSTLAFVPTEVEGKKHEAAPYIYRSGNEFKQVELPKNYDYTVSEWYAEPVKTKAPCWSNPYYDDGGGGVVMTTYSIPLYDKNNNLIGILTSDLEIK
jgi:ketosteroid isomerase-like protein